jgi:hypothetical protein
MYQLGSHQADFSEMYWRLVKSVLKMKVVLQLDKNTGNWVGVMLPLKFPIKSLLE